MDPAEALERKLGLKTVTYKYNLSKDQLFHEAVANDRGRLRVGGPDDEQKAWATKLGVRGPLMFHTDPTCTGRPVEDTFAVAWPEVENEIWWKPSFRKYDPEQYLGLLRRVVEHLNQRRAQLYVQDVFVGHDPAYSVPYRFVGEYATHAMFTHNMFPKQVEGIESPEDKRWTMLNVQSFRCEPERDGSRSDRAAIIDFRNQICLVAGRADYCGLVKKSIFTVMNYLLPRQGYLSMHCSGNVGPRGDTAILFGLSGTGKTTLSADPDRQLIGDDEAGWTEEGVSNLEDGCYAKLIDLDKEAEPIIAAALSMEGTLIENVPPLPGRPFEETDPQELDLADRSITENTRFSYPLACNPNVASGARGGHPETIVLLTADAFGVLPPVAVLEGHEVMYHFVQGFTAKLAGTEVGVTEPQGTFSACFGAPFMSLHPSDYAKLLREKMERHEARCILLNTGWRGGRAGEAPRISIRDTRAMLNAGLAGELHDGMEYEVHPVFHMRMPRGCPGVDASLLDPRTAWTDQSAYEQAAKRLRDMFRENFQKNDYASFGIEPIM
ncbi:MAG: phosphoenolpyruvate carboxykinase (ATP) [Gammaproteobacteria bacterium]|nr:phosphoenolpyruvate carboxykinase (ATP) [Gammaproteobacteria bacterium]NIR84171.1 phosphoenolpyruvate carboxykinase (ATP) [Gammaproteobacteria bacterium]NIR89483.1 phosphoenolpyruvate carboxykinase (ATP) [Gammaproteobacteria bacterium]NIU05326.1 phosphoenolpyruvate carboxykinase (ATP) [Gammaproteobacteria bacterium]NIV52266.1 phosphoenolpyruvate carboxykinase (ATP) [Gammaproteobacteria bacterium]